MPLRKYPPAINADPEWNNLIDFLGGPTQADHISTLHIDEEGSSNNLFANKGRGVALSLGSNVINLSFAEPDTNYMALVIVVGNAATVRVTTKGTSSFIVDASAATSIDWVLIR
jgi:hypothetical protein